MTKLSVHIDGVLKPGSATAPVAVLEEGDVRVASLGQAANELLPSLERWQLMRQSSQDEEFAEFDLD